VVDVTKAAEQMQLYEELGFETALVELEPEQFPDDCQSCVLACTQIAVYVRRPGT